MKKSHDRTFVNLVSIVIGSLIGLAVGIFAFADYIGTRAERNEESGQDNQREVAERIAPVGRVAIAGKDNAALAFVAPPAAAAAAAEPAKVMSGEDTYKATCSACHGTGVAGAPKFGDKVAWKPRLAQGIDTLHQHALKGFAGEAGNMPPKGGNPALADQSVVNAVDYMAKAGK
jgi:cytochrome c5